MGVCCARGRSPNRLVGEGRFRYEAALYVRGVEWKGPREPGVAGVSGGDSGLVGCGGVCEGGLVTLANPCADLRGLSTVQCTGVEEM